MVNSFRSGYSACAETPNSELISLLRYYGHYSGPPGYAKIARGPL